MLVDRLYHMAIDQKNLVEFPLTLFGPILQDQPNDFMITGAGTKRLIHSSSLRKHYIEFVPQYFFYLRI